MTISLTITEQNNDLEVADLIANVAKQTLQDGYIVLSSLASGSGLAIGDRLRNIENLIGSHHDDSLSGNGLVNHLTGLGGDDTLYGYGGDDVLEGGAGADRLEGGAGFDTASYERSDAGVTISLNDDPATASGGHADGDILISIENLRGSQFDDMLTGDDNANVLEGRAGNDVFEGGAGNDIFVMTIENGTVEIIKDFTQGEDKIRFDIDDPSSVTTLEALYNILGITVQNDTDYNQDGKNDTVFTKAGNEQTGDYLLVLEGFTDNLSFTDFDVI